MHGVLETVQLGCRRNEDAEGAKECVQESKQDLDLLLDVIFGEHTASFSCQALVEDARPVHARRRRQDLRGVRARLLGRYVTSCVKIRSTK